MYRCCFIILSLALAAAPLACARPVSVNFSPFSSVDAPSPQIAATAIEIRPGDRPYLSKADAEVLGWVSSRGEPGDSAISEAARDDAAKHGGTHILLRRSKAEYDVEDVPFGPIGSQQIEESERVTYVVLRVSVDKWTALPDVLRPKPLTSTTKQ